jgi:hypothetical protein
VNSVSLLLRTKVESFHSSGPQKIKTVLEQAHPQTISGRTRSVFTDALKWSNRFGLAFLPSYEKSDRNVSQEKWQNQRLKERKE